MVYKVTLYLRSDILPISAKAAEIEATKLRLKKCVHMLRVKNHRMSFGGFWAHKRD